MVVAVGKQYLAATDPALTSANQRVSFGAKYSGNGFVLKEGSAAAGFKKKKGVLTVKIQYS